MGFLWRKSIAEKPDKIIKLTNQYFERIDDTKKVFDIFNSVLYGNEKIIKLDFSQCTHISVTGITILAALAPLISQQNRKLIIHLNNSTQLCNHFFHSEKPDEKRKTLQFSLLTDETVVKVLNELRDIPDMKSLEPAFYFEIWSRCYELCWNANEHASNSIGAGFFTTINFINKYKGQMVLCTDDIYCIIKNNNKHFQKLNSPIIGTLITISIKIK